MTHKIGTREFKVHLSNDAHSRTDIMIEVDNGVLFTGDNVLNGRIGRIDDGTFKGNIRAIDHALALKPKVVVPGHGNTGGPAVLKAQGNYMRTLIEAVRREYNAGKSDYEMKPVVAKQLSAYSKWNGFDSSIGKHISLAILEIEQE
jgi:glyoxylase-like metal-dependent hydrolase (beta-lactamase superfamily II)